jgi:hypothetical protein
MVVVPTRVRAVVVVSALALAAGLLSLAMLAKPAQTQAQTDMFNERVPQTFVIPNPCTGEDVFVEGTSHLVFQRTEDANGGFHFKGHVNFQGRGVSASGAEYVVHESSNTHDNFRDFSESATNFTFTATLKLVRQGSATPADDFEAKVTFHFTILANGELTSEVVKTEAVCK